MTLDDFIQYSLNSTALTGKLELSISDEACRAIKKHTQLNVCKYKFIVQEEYVRHVKNRHEEDLYLLTKLPEILNSFSHVEKSLTRNAQTGQTDVSLVFRKKFDDDIVRMVALRMMKGKTLSLKTFFRQ
jgi:hypothetical protein